MTAPEQREILPLRPGERIPTRPELERLAGDNPILTILNQKTLTTKFAGGWDPIQFNSAQVVDVLTADGPKEIVVDGYHRFAIYLYLAGVWEAPFLENVLERKKPTSPFTVINTNNTYFNNPHIVLPDEPVIMHERKRMLSPEQCARALVTPTEEQPEIAKRRKAAHIIELWKQKVGERLAEKHPALGALTLLDTTKDQQQREEHFQKEPEPERKILMAGITSIQSTIPEIKGSLPDIMGDVLAMSVFTPDALGGEEAKRKQLRSMLSVIATTHGDTAGFDANSLAHAFDNLVASRPITPQNEEGLIKDFAAVPKILTNPAIPNHQKRKLVLSRNPSFDYHEWLREQDRKKAREKRAAFAPTTPIESPAKKIIRLTAERNIAQKEVTTLTKQHEQIAQELAKALEEKTTAQTALAAAQRELALLQQKEVTTSHVSPEVVFSTSEQHIETKKAAEILTTHYLRFTKKRIDDLSPSERRLINLVAKAPPNERSVTNNLIKRAAATIDASASLYTQLASLADTPANQKVKDRLLFHRATVFNPITPGLKESVNDLMFYIEEIKGKLGLR